MLKNARRLISQEDSAMIQRPDIPRSTFRGAWTRKTTFNAGLLVPFLVDEILPGDMMKYRVSAFIRMQTPLYPIMDNQRIDTFFFFVPNRLVWENWVRFMGQQDNPNSAINYTIPVLTSPAGGFAQNSIYDQFGLPCNGQIAGGFTINVNSLPLRAYNLIYNEWFRDQNTINSLTVRRTDTGDAVADFSLQTRAKAHDYFTSCLPWPQKFTAPSVAINGTAPVTGIGIAAGNFSVAGSTFIETPSNTAVTYPFAQYTSLANQVAIRGNQASGGRPQIFADLSGVGIDVNSLRQAWLVQQLLERDARGGTRYTEVVKTHFGVTSPDARLQRPEIIGVGSSPFNVTPVAQTSPSTGNIPTGVLGAAVTNSGTHTASFAATEHGFVIGLMNVRTELSYGQGLHKMWTRSTRYDYYWPSLAGLGEQAVLRRELYCTGVTADDTTIFGYQERWHEYRTRVSEVTGMFRSTNTGTLDAWHLAERFTSAPVLGQTFIQDQTAAILSARTLPAGTNISNAQYLADILIERDATRAIPMYGTPSSIGRL
jgi:hypothetical protein